MVFTRTEKERKKEANRKHREKLRNGDVIKHKAPPAPKNIPKTQMASKYDFRPLPGRPGGGDQIPADNIVEVIANSNDPGPSSSTAQIALSTATGHGSDQSSNIINRRHRGNTLNADGVDVIAILKKDGKKCFVLVRQYRVPMVRWILKFPVGLIDETDKSIEQAGIRELKEKTGYTVTRVIRCTPRGQFLNPGLSSDSSSFLLVEVDGNDPVNMNHNQSLDSDESIEVVLVEYDKLLEYLDEVTKNGNGEVVSQLYAFALSRLL